MPGTLGAIEGSDFATALFTTGLGPNPIGGPFRDDRLTRP
jgi:hypothetical protein